MDRRSTVRRKVTGLSYIQLGQANGGFLLDISEGGLCFQLFDGAKASELSSPIRFQLPHSGDWIESAGKEVWASEARAAAGLEFVDLSDAAREHIRNWITWHAAEADSSGGPSSASSAQRPQADFLRDGGSRNLPGDLPPVLAALAPKLRELTEAPMSTAETAGGAAPSSASDAPTAIDEGAVRSAGSSVVPRMLGPTSAAAPSTRASSAAVSSINGLQSLAAAAAKEQLQLVVHLRSPWTLTILISVLVLFSFALGVVVGHGLFDHWLGTSSSLAPDSRNAAERAGALPPAGAANAAATSPDRGLANAATASPPPVNSGSKPSPATPNTPKGATTSAAGGSSGSHRQAFSSVYSKDDTTTFSEPSHPVSATATIAINSQRSVSLPNKLVTTFDDSDPGFHFGALSDHTDPSYPPQAIDEGVEGTVELHVSIAPNGGVENVQAVSGAYLLQVPAIAAVRTWRYKPTYVNGHAVETNDTLLISFRMPH